MMYNRVCKIKKKKKSRNPWSIVISNILATGDDITFVLLKVVDNLGKEQVIIYFRHFLYFVILQFYNKSLCIFNKTHTYIHSSYY